MSRHRLAFDIGGTFTDFVLVNEDTGEVRLHKLLTTPSDPAAASLQGIQELVSEADVGHIDISLAVHGTTLVTNAIIERKGAKVGLLTTRGFRDAMEIGREQRYDIDDLFITFPSPLVPRKRRLEVGERMSRDGEILRELDEHELKQAIGRLKDEGVESVAVCFLHSYRNSVHELQARNLIRDAYPELPVSTSSEVAPEIREYERVVTTSANAYVMPLVQRYLSGLESKLGDRGFGGELYLMQSNGGTTSVDEAKSLPISLLESGPAGGAIYTSYVGQLIGKTELLSFDMGGTTAKACLVQDGKPDLAPQLEAAREHRFKRGSGLPIKAPVIDMIEIGAGGGSIARVNQLGLLQVGPDSAGAEPGPACYGSGGNLPTVTDANLLLGYLNPEYFLGGRLTLDIAAAEQAVEGLARELGITTPAAALGIHQLVSENMASAARIHIVEKGRDPRAFAMVAFGGAAPAHASRVARLLGVEEVIIPQGAGAASAVGFLVAPLAFDLARSLPGEIAALPASEIDAVLQGLEAEGTRRLRESGFEGTPSVSRTADMRILGQVHEIQVPVPPGAVTDEWRSQLAKAFEEEYRRLFEHLPPVAGVEVLNWRVRVSGPQPRVDMQPQGPRGRSNDALKGHRPAIFEASDSPIVAAVYDRYALVAGNTVNGPAIIEEREATTVLLPGDVATVDDLGQLRILVKGGSDDA